MYKTPQQSYLPPVRQPYAQPAKPQATKPQSNTMLIVFVVGIFVLIFGGIAYYFLSKNNEEEGIDYPNDTNMYVCKGGNFPNVYADEAVAKSKCSAGIQTTFTNTQASSYKWHGEGGVETTGLKNPYPRVRLKDGDQVYITDTSEAAIIYGSAASASDSNNWDWSTTSVGVWAS